MTVVPLRVIFAMRRRGATLLLCLDLPKVRARSEMPQAEVAGFASRPAGLLREDAMPPSAREMLHVDIAFANDKRRRFGTRAGIDTARQGVGTGD
jgi:hypothetical protein